MTDSYEHLRKEEEALELLGKFLPPDHPDFLRCKRQLPEAYLNSKLVREAKVILEEVHAAQSAALGSDALDMLDTEHVLADVVSRLGDNDRCLRLLRHEVDGRTRVAGEYDLGQGTRSVSRDKLHG